MPTTYTLIASNTLGSNTASVTFSSIPNTYTDLVLKMSTRTNDTSNSYFRVYFNGDTSSVTTYSSRNLRTNTTTTPISGSVTSGGIGISGNIYTDSNAETANTFSNTELYIPSYLINQNKPVSTSSVYENNSSTFKDGILLSVAGLWSNTAEITSITITNVSTINFVTNSSFYLYGIKNS